MRKQKTPIAKDISKHFADEKYRMACAEPYLWINKAKEVQRAADLLWQQYAHEVQSFVAGVESPEPFFGGVAMMLYGLAMENYLKAGLASKGVAAGPNGNFNQNSHDLERLAHDFGFELTPAEAELMERLQGFVEWAGRYPIPLHRDRMYPREMVDGSRASLYGVSGGDGAATKELLRKIELRLPTEEEAIKSYAKNYHT